MLIPSTVVCATGHQIVTLCMVVCQEEKTHFWILWWEVGIVISSFRGLFCIKFLVCFLCLQNLTTYWTGFSNSLLNRRTLSSRQPTPEGIKAMWAPERRIPRHRGLIEWRRLGRLVNFRDCLWLGLQISWPNPVFSIVNSIGAICRCWITGHLKTWGTIKAPNILPWTSECV